MKLFLIILSFLILINYQSYSQKKAIITKTGEEVVLNNDGTWKYVFDDPTGSIKIDTVMYNKPKDANFLLESSKLKYGIWINKKDWIYTKNEDDGSSTPTEFKLRLKGEDAYGMVVAEKIEVPIENLMNIAVQNAKNAAPDTKVVKKGCRKINGVNLYFMQMEGTIQGVKFAYLGYYYSDANGSVQFLTYTSQNLLKDYRVRMENLLNGFVIR